MFPYTFFQSCSTNYYFYAIFSQLLTLFTVMVNQKGSPNSFSPVTSTHVGISPQNLMTFNYNPFVTLV